MKLIICNIDRICFSYWNLFYDWNLIDSFSFINLGQADINNIEVTGGISEALVSTAAGLIVAITSLMFSNYFKIEFQRELPLIQEFLVQFEIARTEKNN